MTNRMKKKRVPAGTWLVLCIHLIVSASQALGQPHNHDQAESAGSQEQVELTGQLVDVTWFFNSQADSKGQDQSTRATNRLAAGTPAGLLTDGAGKPEDIWYLVTNSAPLAPYAGKTIKVEGRRLTAIHAIEPAALYLKDGEEWRQVQLRVEGPTGVPPQGAGMEHGEPKHDKPAGAQHGEAASSKPAESAGAEHGRANHAEEKPGEVTGSHGGKQNKQEHEGGGNGGHNQNQGRDENQGHEHGFGALLTMPPLHPILVNFTAGLFPMAILADLLGRLLRRKSLHAAAWWMLLFAAVITPFTALAGWLWYSQVGDMGHVQMHIHPWLGSSFAILLPLLAVWRGRVYARDQTPSRGYLISAAILLLALMVQGHLGATMSFPSTQQSSSHASGGH